MKTINLTNKEVYTAIQANEYNTIRVHEVKVGSKWIEKEFETSSYTYDQKKRFISKDTLQFFKNLGGRETVKQGTFKGIGATINVSLSPCKTERKTTYFLF